MELEHHQLDLKYERLRQRDRREEGRLLGSLERDGQRVPLIVIPSEEPGRYVVVDGFRRLRALRRLGRDTVQVLVWEEGEVDALVTAHHLAHPRPRSPLEDAYLIRALQKEHGLPQREIARRLGHTQSWVSRRLGLVSDLPSWLQTLVRSGEVSCRAATRCLLPMARAIKADAELLGQSLRGTGLSTRQVESLYKAWRSGDERGRRLVVEQPVLVLRSLEATEEADWARPADDAAKLLSDLEKVLALSRRASRLLDRVLLEGAEPETVARLPCAWRKVRATWELLETRLEEEGILDDRSRNAPDDPCVARGRAEPTDHRSCAGGVPELRAAAGRAGNGGRPGAVRCEPPVPTPGAGAG